MELPGIEPGSIHATNTPPTCLAFWLIFMKPQGQLTNLIVTTLSPYIVSHRSFQETKRVCAMPVWLQTRWTRSGSNGQITLWVTQPWRKYFRRLHCFLNCFLRGNWEPPACRCTSIHVVKTGTAPYIKVKELLSKLCKKNCPGNARAVCIERGAVSESVKLRASLKTSFYCKINRRSMTVLDFTKSPQRSPGYVAGLFAHLPCPQSSIDFSLRNRFLEMPYNMFTICHTT